MLALWLMPALRMMLAWIGMTYMMMGHEVEIIVALLHYSREIRQISENQKIGQVWEYWSK